MPSKYLALILSCVAVLVGCAEEMPTETDSAVEAVTTESASEQSPEVVKEKVAKEEVGLPAGMLSIGSKAPALDIEHWVSDGSGQFSKVTEFTKDKVYVVEFWATWCGPCVASMPHLAEIQTKLKDKVQIISVSDEDLDTVTGFLEKPYTRGEEDGPQTFAELTSVYCLTTDPDGSTSKDYMQAAGQAGIPACFIVGKTGLVEWIGHPMEMDQPLAKVLDGNWDREPFAAEFKKSQITTYYIMQIGPAFESGDMVKAKELLEKAKEIAADPRDINMLMRIELTLIIQKHEKGDTEGAIADLENIIENGEGQMKDIAKQVLSKINEQINGESAEETEATDEGDDS